MPRTIPFAVVFALAFAPLPARAQDAEKAATEAQKQLADIQKQLAGGNDNQKRLRIDKFEAAGDTVKVTGVFLDVPAAKADDPVPFEQVTDELFKSLRDRLKSADLKFDAKGITRVPLDKHPHVVLQLAANAAGEKSPVADQVKFDGSRFSADGALVLVGIRGQGEAVEKWIGAEVAKTLAKHPAVRPKDERPIVADELKEVEWKLSPAGVQKALAASTDAATRRLRADRAYFAYEVTKDGDKTTVSGIRYVVNGIRLGEDKLDVVAVQDTCRKLWPEVLGGTNQIPVTVDFGAGITEPAARLQAVVAERTALDGVRIDPGAEFGPASELMLSGIQPGLGAGGEMALTAAVQAVLKELIDKGDAAADRYKRLAAGTVSVRKMKVVESRKLLAELRDWAANTVDDAKLSRLYFAADTGLRLQARTVTKADGDKLLAKFKQLVPDYMPVANPDAPPKNPEPVTEPSLFQAGLTARLRKDMAGDQKKWNGVLIERGYFDADGHYTIRGVVDAAEQNDALTILLGKIGTEPQFAEYFTPAPNKPALDVVPMSELLDRVKRVTPGYATFDGIRIESARYDADVNLIFDAHVVGKPDAEAATLLAKMLRDNPKYKRRAPADKEVKIAPLTGAKYADDQVADFSVALGAKLLTKAGDSKEARAKAKEWLDTAILHYPNEAAVWFLSAYYNYAFAKDDELTRRDLYRMIDLEGPLAFNGPAQRKRRYEAAKDFQGKTRTELEALWLECFREVKDGARPITLTPKK